MPSCCVPNCDSGYATKIRVLKEQGVNPPSFFKIKEKDLELYNKAIPRKDRKLTIKDYVCSEHFHEQDIIRYHEDLTIGSLIVKGEKLKAPRLKEGAVPSIFTGPKYLSKPEPKKRKAPKERDPLPTKAAKHDKENEEPLVIDPQPNSTEPEQPEPPEPPESDQNPDFINISLIQLPPKGWAVHKYPSVYHFVGVDVDCNVTHALSVDKEKNMIFRIGKNSKLRQFRLEDMTRAQNESDIEAAIHQLNALSPCEGDGFGHHSNHCKGGVKIGLRCPNCRGKRKSERKKINRQAAENRKRNTTARSKRLHRYGKQNKLMRIEIKSLKGQLRDLRKQCAKLEKNQVEKEIEGLPPLQQLAVLAILAAAKRKGPKGNRFLIEWIYECMLMRIKSPKLYEHLRSRKILVLPSRTTLNRYMRKLHPGYGYQPQLFEVLKQKIANFDETAKHGIIMVDEIKTECGVTFDRHTLKFMGMVDVGTHTPKEQTNVLADHVLEVIFKPFQGGWYQSLGCFLTKGAAAGPVLAKVLLEGTSLCEQAGLKVDAFVTDGGTWNRNMWEEFGIDMENNSCEHPLDENRKLWFFSDWCHLLKCMRNNVVPVIPNKKKKVPKTKNKKRTEEMEMELDNPDEPEIDEQLVELHAEQQDAQQNKEKKKDSRYRLETDAELKERKKAALNKEIETPDGTVKRSHWTSLYNLETKMAQTYGIAAMTYVPKLTKQHVFPSGFERMNVKMAFQFFSNSVQAGMQWYRKKGYKELEDSEPTEAFISKVNALADSMNSSDAKSAYRKGSKHEEIITGFIDYLKESIELSKRKGRKAFISESTDLGLLVTLKSTVELCNYLIDDIGFKYVMTARFNQDTIEQFFSNIRSALGPNNHPTAKQYAQVHRLLSIYSLIQPPKGSNVSGAENLKSLLTADDMIAQAERDRKESIEETLDEIVEMGEAFDSLPVVHQIDHSYLRQAPDMEENMVKFMAGFTAHRQKMLAESCDACVLTFTQFREEADSGHDFTRMKEIYNGYSYATNELATLIKSTEHAVQQAVHIENLHEDLFVHTIKYLKLGPGELVGCLSHMHAVSKKIIKFYLIMRMFFIAEKKSQEVKDQNKKKKALSKQAKLQ